MSRSSGAEPAAGPHPPCGIPAVPAFAALGEPPAIQVWNEGDLGADWLPPACTGWTTPGFASLVALAGTLHHAGDAASLLARFGAVSALRSVRYWSVTDAAWRPLVVDATALSEPRPDRPRADFTAAELASGTEVFIAEADGRSSGPVVQRMQALVSTADRIVVGTSNVDPVKFYFVTLFPPGGLATVHFLDRVEPSTWTYYSLVRVGPGASLFAGGHARSYVNRSAALFRYLGGMPTDMEPPAAP